MVLLKHSNAFMPHKAPNNACSGREQEAEVYQRSMAAVNELESQFGALWTQCQRCQGSLHQV
jgi:C4-type zinc-finger of DNA polymerase delta